MKWETALWMAASLLLASLPRGQLNTTCHAFVGETVVLPCSTKPPESLSKSMLYWQNGLRVVHFYENGQDSLKNQDQHFHGRTSVFPDQMKLGNLSLKLSNVQLVDTAEYTCIYTQSKDHPTQKSEIKLIVTAPPRTEEPPSLSGQSQTPPGSPADVPRLAVLLLSFLLLVPLGLGVAGLSSPSLPAGVGVEMQEITQGPKGHPGSSSPR